MIVEHINVVSVSHGGQFQKLRVEADDKQLSYLAHPKQILPSFIQVLPVVTILGT